MPSDSSRFTNGSESLSVSGTTSSTGSKSSPSSKRTNKSRERPTLTRRNSDDDENRGAGDPDHPGPQRSRYPSLARDRIRGAPRTARSGQRDDGRQTHADGSRGMARRALVP